MRRLELLAASVACLWMIGCQITTAPWQPPFGAIWTKTKGINPFTVVESSDGVRRGSKTGRACATGYLGILSRGDMSLKAAKEDGQITRVDTLDWETTNMLTFLVVENCTVITGE